MLNKNITPQLVSNITNKILDLLSKDNEEVPQIKKNLPECSNQQIKTQNLNITIEIKDLDQIKSVIELINSGYNLVKDIEKSKKGEQD
jgi:hypothetical protein